MINAPDFWYRQKSFGDVARRTLLAPFGHIYGWLTRKKFDLYFPVPMIRPIICVGNIVAGGAGKTPVVLALTKLLQDKGYNPHLLTRGYGGTEQGPLQVAPSRDTAADVGDEALLLVDAAPTWVSANRPLGAQEAMDSGATIVVMDDGFQNPVIYKDFSIVVVDGGAGFGNRHVMPAGPLREDAAFGLSRADVAVIVGADTSGSADYIRRLNSVPILTARIVPDTANPDVKGRKVSAFAGIGRPQKFRETLEEAGAEVVEWAEFPDHFPYDDEDLKDIVAKAEQDGLMLVTTAKDHVRLPAPLRARIEKFSVSIAWDDAATLAAMIETALRKRMT